jgi:hypothetical protein
MIIPDGLIYIVPKGLNRFWVYIFSTNMQPLTGLFHQKQNIGKKAYRIINKVL